MNCRACGHATHPNRKCPAWTRQSTPCGCTNLTVDTVEVRVNAAPAPVVCGHGNAKDHCHACEFFFNLRALAAGAFGVFVVIPVLFALLANLPYLFD